MGNILVWDLDHSLLVDHNSDIVVLEQLHGEEKAAEFIDEYRKRERKGYRWANMMNDALKEVEIGDIDRVLKGLLIDPCILDAVKWAGKNGYKQVVLSDANDYFIRLMLESVGISQYFVVISNPASVLENRLSIRPLHPISTVSQCPLYTCDVLRNDACIGSDLCKSIALASVLEPGASVSYVGDGLGDYCPAVNHVNTTLFAKYSSRLAKLCKDMHHIRVVQWKGADELSRAIMSNTH